MTRRIAIWFATAGLLSQLAGAAIVYVDDDAPPGGDGQTWASAFSFLRDALAVAQAGDEIRVAGGTYYPDRDVANPLGTGNRDLSFDLVSGVAIYGGFAGLSLPGDPDLRDFELFPSTLSGNIGSPTNALDNSAHVVKAVGTGAGTTLDGVTIREGHASPIGGGERVREDGLGIHASSAALTLRRCTITNNLGAGIDFTLWNANTIGAGIYCSQSVLDLIECSLTENVAGSGGYSYSDFSDDPGAVTDPLGPAPGTERAGRQPCAGRDHGGVGGDGGGVYACNGSIVRMVSCVLTGNRAGQGGTATMGGSGGAGGRGGAIFVATSSHLEAVNCIIAANRGGRGGGGSVYGSGGAGGAGGGIYVGELSSLRAVNCRICGNNAGNAGGGGGRAGGDGAGIYVGATGRVQAVHCLVSGNLAGNGSSGRYGGDGGCGAGLFTESHDVLLVGSTFASNDAGQAGTGSLGNGEPGHGGALYCDDVVPNVENCIVWDATPEPIVGLPEITYSDVQGGWTGMGNISGDPLFVDPDGPDNDPNTWADNDFRLATGSPCIDAGNNVLPPRDEFDLDADGCVTEPLPIDLDGHARYVDDPATPDTGNGAAPLVDMGAYEYPDSAGPPAGPCAGDVNCDGVINFDDIDPFVLALSDPVAYGAAYPDCYVLSADIDHDGDVDFEDVDWFVGLLSGRQP